MASGERANLHHPSDLNTFRLTSRKYWYELKRDLRPIYTAVNATAARAALDELTAKWAARYPAVIRLWESASEEFIPFLDYDVKICRVLCRLGRAAAPGGEVGLFQRPVHAGEGSIVDNRPALVTPGRPVYDPVQTEKQGWRIVLIRRF